MSIIIGGSPSTGSSLLRRMLNRHSMIFCGSETSILSKEALYQDWNGQKNRLFKKGYSGLLNAGWHHYRGFDLEEDYKISLTELKDIIGQANAFSGFISLFSDRVLSQYSKTIWSEKTPSNAYTMSLYLDKVPDALAIHITRHPLDTIASLVNRGMDYYNAIAVYLMNTSAALESRNHPRCVLVKYEDLSRKPKETMVSLLASLSIPYEDSVLIPDAKPIGVTQMKGWNYDESGMVKDGSIGRFEKLDDNTQLLIMSGIDLLQSTSHSINSIRQIADILNYKLSDYNKSSDHNLEHHRYYSNQMSKDIWKRFYKQSYYKKNNYPISIMKS